MKFVTLRESAVRFIMWWTEFIQKFRLWVIFACVLGAIAAFHYAANNLGMNTDTKDMLSPDLPWRQLDLEYERDFPEYVSNIIVVVEAATPDQAVDGANRIVDALADEQSLFTDVFYPRALSIFRESALLFLETDELQDLADNLAAIQPFLGKLTDDQNIRGLFTMLVDAVDAIDDGEDIDLDPLVAELTDAFKAVNQERLYRMSWQKLMSGEDDGGPVFREFILLQPKLDYSQLFPAAEPVEFLHKLFVDLRLREDVGVRARLTGSVVLGHEEMLSVAKGTKLAMFLALVVVTLIMAYGLASARLVFATLVTLLTGLLFTAAFAAATVGELNLISVAFAILYIGLGVDFAVHYCLRYRELLLQGTNHDTALVRTSASIGPSIFLCAVTTAIGFLAFMPTDYDGVAELGWISGVGIFISLIVTLTLLPVILSLLPKGALRRNHPKSTPHWLSVVQSIPQQHNAGVQKAFVVIIVVSLLFLSQAKFDHNTLNLQDPNNESVKTYRDLLIDSKTSPWTGILLARSREEALQIITRVEGLPVVDDAVWIEDFIPSDQESKLEIIEEMNFLLAGLSVSAGDRPVSSAERMQALKHFLAQLQTAGFTRHAPAWQELHKQIRLFTDNATAMAPAARGQALVKLEKSLLQSLPGRLQTLQASLNADYVNYENLPPPLATRWLSENNTYRIEIYPAENIQDNRALRRFVEALQAVDHRLIGAPVVNLEASDAVIQAFIQAFTYAFLAITLFLFVLLTYRRDVLLVLAPLIAAAICTGGISVIVSIPFNFANVIALPLLLGIGVDSGIHILHRFRTALPANGNVLSTSSARAVVVSALTTAGSIGNLAFSPHQGTASMGEMLSIGIATTLACTLLLLPSLLTSFSGRQSHG